MPVGDYKLFLVIYFFHYVINIYMSDIVVVQSGSDWSGNIGLQGLDAGFISINKDSDEEDVRFQSTTTNTSIQAIYGIK